MKEKIERPLGPRGLLRLLAGLFIVTGCSALVAEQAFEKLLGTLLGTSTPAAAVVLAVYFGGLALGSAAYGRWLRPLVGNPLRAFVLLEAGVGVWSLLLRFGFSAMSSALSRVLALGVDHFLLLQLIRGATAMLWILPPTFLMGATFPAIVDALETLGLPGSKLVSRFYSYNLLGAIVGSVIAPYLVFPRWGLSGALDTTAALDLLAAATTWIVMSSSAPLGLREPGSPQADAPVGGPAPGGFGLLLVIGAFSGFLFFSLEILWTHLISVVLGNSVYAFATMLGTVLLGLFIGGMLSAHLFPARRVMTAAVPGLILLASSLLLRLSHSRWSQVPHAFSVWGGSLETFSQGEILRWIQALLLLLPSATALGVVYPVLFRLDVFPRWNRASAVGRMGALNSLGCILGALVTGFVLIPAIGSEATLALLTLLCAISGALLCLLDRSPGRRLASISLAGAVIFLIGPGHLRRLGRTAAHPARGSSPPGSGVAEACVGRGEPPGFAVVPSGLAAPRPGGRLADRRGDSIPSEHGLEPTA